MATSLPEGTITLLFTDIEGSTALLHRLGDGYATVLADQRAILRDAFARWNGHEVDTQGDAVFAVFARAGDAIAAAADAQRALELHRWRTGTVSASVWVSTPASHTCGPPGTSVWTCIAGRGSPPPLTAG